MFFKRENTLFKTYFANSKYNILAFQMMLRLDDNTTLSTSVGMNKEELARYIKFLHDRLEEFK